MLFDSHAHIDDEKFKDETIEDIIARAQKNDVGHIMNVGACMISSERSVQLAANYEAIYAMVGVHPEEIEKIGKRDYDQLAEWTQQPKVVGIGEIGLDYYWNPETKEEQQKVFIRQLDVARQMHMPVCIHDRDAHGDMMKILKSEGKGLVGVLHCFSGSMEMAKELIKMGWYLGVDGPVTFKNAAKLPEIMAEVPLERILVETDSPYLTPVPLRGKRNEPAYVRHVAEYVANLRKIEYEAFAKATTQNVCDLFQIKF